MKQQQVDPKYLYSIPHIQQEYFIKEDNVILIIRRDKILERLICWLFKKPRIDYLSLDLMGSKTFLLINGKRTIQDISRILFIEFPDHTLESMQVRVAKFLAYLYQNQFIKI